MIYLFALSIIVAPAYILKFVFWGFSTNLLMLWVLGLWFGFGGYLTWKGEWLGFGSWLWQQLKSCWLWLVLGFFLAGVVSIFVGGRSTAKLGQFIVLFLQPISVFILAKYSTQTLEIKTKFTNLLLFTVYCLLFFTGSYAIVQYFTLLGVPLEWWGNPTEPKRALAFFLHPNFFALFITPLLAFTLPSVAKLKILNPNIENRNESENKNSNFTNTLKVWVPLVSWILGVLGLALSMSRGGWLGLAAACVVFVLAMRNKKIFLSALVIFIVMVTVALSVPNFRYRLILPFKGEKSAVSRLSLISTGWSEIKVHPILGSGLLGFSNNWDLYNTDPGLAHHPTPHNLYIALWIDTGLLGLVSFLGLCFYAIWQGIRHRQNLLRFGLALAMVAILAHGLVDTPYFKNDLAMLFWLLLINL